LWAKKLAQKLWPELAALAFQDLGLSQNYGQAVTLAQPGLA
jgi:hypothetical protein